MYNPSTTLTAALMMLTIATWNVNGTSIKAGTLKLELIVDQMIDYKIDICALQETKTVLSEELMFKGYKVVLLGGTNRHWGIGYIISPRYQSYVLSYQLISNRVGVLDVCLPSRNGQSKVYRFVNAYAPHSGLTINRVAGPRLLDKFYSELAKSLKVAARHELFILGDFNSKLGRLSKEEIDNGVLSSHVGRYGAGQRNANGEQLLQFLIANDLFAVNTAFQHPSRHITTREGSIAKPGRAIGSKETVPIYAQLDYVLCRRNAKCLFTNARSYNHVREVITTDHKLVRARLNLKNVVLLHKRREPKFVRYDVNNLLANRDVKEAYQATLGNEMVKLDKSGDPNQQLIKLFDSIKRSAEAEIGVKKPQQKQHYSQDNKLLTLIEKKTKLRAELHADNRARDRTAQRTLINKTEKEIKNRVKEIEVARANSLCDSITNTDSSRQMFEAVRELTNTKKNSASVHVHNKEGMNICSDQLKAEAIKSYFEEQFTDSKDGPLPAFEGPPKPLDTPITALEVKVATAKLKNGKSNGPDNIPNELLKAWHPDCNLKYADILNDSFSTNQHISSIGEGILTPLQKPGKTKGPVKSLRPLMLLNGSRKILSLITLHRISKKIDTYTGPWQAAYKNGRSCSDLVWSKRMLISVVKNKQWEFSEMGIDMSAAFDTIRRSTILGLLKDAGCTDDEVRLVRYLLSNTKLRVRVNNDMSVEFESSLGAFQGDSLSGKLFTLLLAGCLYEVRSRLGRNEPPVSDLGVPDETEYADDVNFLDEDMEKLKAMLPHIKDILGEWNLFVNDTKTEYTRVHLAGVKEVNTYGKKIREFKLEDWRSTKLLGSLLCSVQDILRRCQLGNVAFESYNKCWLKGSNIPLQIKIRLYDSLVASVMLYNCNSWAVPDKDLEKLDTTHRRHLRRILNTSRNPQQCCGDHLIL